MKEYMKEPLPNFFIAGAAKSGTTSLYNYLRQHPQIYLPPIKEVYFFATDIDNKKFRPNYARDVNINIDKWMESGMKTEIFQAFISDWEKYKSLFRFAENKKAIGEMTNAYLYSTQAAKNISQKFPDAKIIMILRNPVERVFSHYLMDLRTGYESGNFMEELKKDMSSTEKGWGISNLYIELGMYYEQVKRFTDSFPGEQVKIFLYEDFKNYPEKVLTDICKFLELSEDYKFDFSKSYNVAYVPKSKLVGRLLQNNIVRFIKENLSKSFITKLKMVFFTSKNKPVMTAEERKFLAGIYHDDINKLSSLINTDLSSWTADTR